MSCKYKIKKIKFQVQKLYTTPILNLRYKILAFEAKNEWNWMFALKYHRRI